MKKILIALFVLGSCGENKKQAFQKDCSSFILKKHLVFSPDSISISFPGSWKIIDSVAFLKPNPLSYSKTFQSHDSTGDFYYSVSDFGIHPRESDFSSLTAMLKSRIEFYKNGRDSLLEVNTKTIRGWRMVVMKSYVKTSKFTIAGQILCSKQNREIDLYVEITSPSFSESNQFVDCVINSLSFGSLK